MCKNFFLATLGYAAKNDRIITNVMSKEDIRNIRPSSGGRGKHVKVPKLDLDVMRSHVEFFCLSISHCRREHAPNKRYLPSDLTIKSMQADLLNSHPLVKCSYELYRKFVSDDLNISFTALGHECETCEVFKFHNVEHSA